VLRRIRQQMMAQVQRVDQAALDAHLARLGRDGPAARRLDAAVDEALASVLSLSELTAPVALGYIERLARPIPALTPELGAVGVTRPYVAHLVVERDPAAFGATDVPVLGTLPPLRHNRPPADLTSRVVKATRRGFELIRAVPASVWDGFVYATAAHLHDQASAGAGPFLEVAVVDGLARFGWVLRQVDLHYGLEPETGGR